MSSTPAPSERQASLIREMNRSLSASRQQAGNLLPEADTTTNRIPLDIDLSNQDFTLPSELGLDESMPEFRNLDLPKSTLTPEIRTTAKKYGFYHPPSAQPHITSSAVRREFQDFDQGETGYEYDHDDLGDESSMSVEAGRGLRRPKSYATSKLDYQDALSPSHLYSLDTNDLNKDSPLSKRVLAHADENLRKSVQIRSASHAIQRSNDGHSKHGAFKQGRVPSYAETSARLMADYPESSFVSDKPSPQAKPSRFAANSKLRTVSTGAEAQMPARFVPGKGLQPAANTKTPLRAPPLASRNAGGANSTRLSFALPEIENLTDIMAGHAVDVNKLTKSMRSKSRFSAPGAQHGPSTAYPPLSSLPLPDEEKKIMASLRILKESVANLKRENTDLRRTCESQELEILELRGIGEAKEPVRNTPMAKEKSKKLESEFKSAQASLRQAEREIALSEDTIRQITHQRDQAFAESERMDEELQFMKEEKKAVERENNKLKKSILRLEDQSNQLRGLLPDSHKDAQPGLKAGRSTGAQHEELLTSAERALHLENLRLRHQIDELNSELDEIRNIRDNETKTWLRREVELQNLVIDGGRTLRQLQDGLTGVVNVAQTDAPKPATKAEAETKSDGGLQSVLNQFVSLHSARKQFRNQQREAKLRSLERLDRQAEDETLEWRLQGDALAEEIKRRNVFSASFESQVNKIVNRVPDDVTEVPHFDVRSAAEQLRRQLESDVRAGPEERGFAQATVRPAAEQTTHLDLSPPRKSRAQPVDGYVDGPMSPMDTQIIRELRMRVEREYLTRQLDDDLVDGDGGVLDHHDDGVVNGIKDQSHTIDGNGVETRQKIGSGDEAHPPTMTLRDFLDGQSRDRTVSGGTHKARIPSTSSVPSRTKSKIGPGVGTAGAASSVSSSTDEPTVRPSQSSLAALDTVMTDIEADIGQLRTTLSSLSSRLANSDPKESRRMRKRLIDNIMQVLSHLDVNSDRMYHLQDARYGLVDGIKDGAAPAGGRNGIVADGRRG